MTLCAHKHPQTCHPNNQRMNGLMHWRSSLAPWLLQCPSPSFHHRPWGTSEMRRRYANLWGRRLARKIWVFSKVEIRYPRSLPQVPLLKDMDMQKRREFVEETDCCFTCGTIGIHLPEPVTNPLQTKWHCATTCFNYQTCYIPSVRTTLTSILLKALNHSLNNFLSNTIKHISCLHGITVRTWNPTQHQPVIPFQRVFHDSNFLKRVNHPQQPSKVIKPSLVSGSFCRMRLIRTTRGGRTVTRRCPEAPDWRCRSWRCMEAAPLPAPRVKETAWLRRKRVELGGSEKEYHKNQPNGSVNSYHKWMLWILGFDISCDWRITLIYVCLSQWYDLQQIPRSQGPISQHSFHKCIKLSQFWWQKMGGCHRHPNYHIHSIPYQNYYVL